MIKIAPSILAADPLNLERDVRRAVESGCDWIHVDVMDANFVPNLAYTPETVRRLKNTFNIPLDVHLMMIHPETLINAFIESGADILTIHCEIGSQVPILLDRIHKAGIHPGLALKPGTPLTAIEAYRDMADLILTMTVEPGFGGQQLDEHVLDKMRKLVDSGYKGWIEADGGIREDNLPKLITSGLNVAVMGTSLFSSEDMKKTISRIRYLK